MRASLSTGPELGQSTLIPLGVSSWEMSTLTRVGSSVVLTELTATSPKSVCLASSVSQSMGTTHAKGGILDAIIVPEHWCIAESGVVNPDRSSDQLRDHAVVHATVGFGYNTQLDRPHPVQDPVPVQTAMQRLRTTSRSVQDTIWARYSELVRMSSA